MLWLPIAGGGLFVLLAIEWAVCNLFASSVGEMRPGWLELVAIVPTMIVFAVAEVLLAVTARRRGYGALWILFALPAGLAVIACAVWLAGGRADSLGDPMWLLTAVLGGINAGLLLLAVRALRRPIRKRRRTPTPRHSV